MQVLIVKTSSMGDIILTLPALTDAINMFPNIRFDWVVEENFAQIPTWHSAVRHTIPVSIRRWRKNWFGQEIRKERKTFKDLLQQNHYDAVIDAQGLIKSAGLVTRLARGKKHGFDRKSIRELLACWFYDYKHQVSWQHHAVERIRRLFAASLNYPLPDSIGDYAIAKNFTPPSENDPYLIFLHATTRDNKHWPESYWKILLSKATQSGYIVKLPWGAEHEHQRAQRLAQGFDRVEVLPHTNLVGIAKQLVGARAILSVDTGLSHLSAALDRPNLTLYGPTDPIIIGGYGRHQQALRSASGNLKDLTCEEVWQHFKLLL